MSNAQYPLKTARIIDPVIDVDGERRYGIYEGGSRVSYRPLISSSFSNRAATFSAITPSPGIIVDRNIKMSIPVTLDFVGTSSGPLVNLLESGYDAFRAFPISQITETVTATINNSSMSINMADIIDPLMRYNQDRTSQEFFYSTSTPMQDQYQEYADGDDTVNNPLAAYGDNSYETPRGAFPMTITNHTTTTATVNATLTENLFLSPFIWGKIKESGLVGVQNLSFKFAFSGDLSRMWSHSAAGGTITSINVTLGRPTMLLKYITPKENAVIPKVVQYPYYEVVRYPTDANAPIASGASTTLKSANVQLQSIPKQIYIFARERNSDRTFTTSDTYFAINNISVDWDNNTGLLNSASPQDLYDISVENGCKLSWPQWSGTTHRSLGLTDATVGTVGSVLNLRMGKDIGLRSAEAPGQLGTFQLQFNVNVTNVNQTRAITPTLYMVVISEGTVAITENRTIQNIGVLQKQDVLDAKFAPIVPLYEVESVYGGSFLDSVKNFGRNIWDGVKKYGPGVAKFALTNAPKLAPLLALGEDGEYYPVEEELMEERGGLSLAGGQLVGGKKMTRKEMLKRLTMRK